ncbi:MAG TPA: type II toxin-antitoxin system VapC family toxin [Verrucomicrobiota bacterium]|nr:type II toxin-antitoxin system VapC family toxin [Verrucomicrobiota bacterium]HQL78366.1 type II toxin-antitoxin system VapC family toxin [Verrucomicrobiota bacterium]
MKLLLDTHTLLWFLTNDRSLSTQARAAIEAGGNLCSVSAASLWEVAVKVALSKLTLPAPYADIFPRQLEINGFGLLPITPTHCAALLTLPLHHRDPFDRLLLAQAQSEAMTLVSDDGQFAPYGVPVLW